MILGMIAVGLGTALLMIGKNAIQKAINKNSKKGRK